MLTKSGPDVNLDGDKDVLTTSIKIGFSTNCSAIDWSSDQFELGTTRAFWQNDEPFSKFVERYCPIQSHPVLSHPESTAYLDLKSDLGALTIRNGLGVVFLPTEDIRDHLRFDPRRRVVEVFHHTSLLKEHLKRSKEMPATATTSDYIKQGTLPRQLVLEALDSLQAILFPLTDKKSRQLLTAYVNSGSFDPDILKFEFGSIRNKGEENILYVYLTERLSALHHELQNPRPRGWLERQLELRSGARHVMMATMVEILVAVLLGFLSLAVSIFLAYVAYQAWKHPVPATT
ncbi:hypothetical protein C8A03DRAFT_18425 [Achaetomium macrosporum]|uniref:Uncharacterized protein n=1 Tax=Achaetomium macrosporum TaxID=79813 RepID=A0AAN7C4A6_9PEZI|nr:hypothetical protein C8A03DRAFT_18425 [Achaetomium macrosporum]